MHMIVANKKLFSSFVTVIQRRAPVSSLDFEHPPRPTRKLLKVSLNNFLESFSK